MRHTVFGSLFLVFLPSFTGCFPPKMKSLSGVSRPALVEHSHSIMDHLQLMQVMQVMQAMKIPKDVTNLILQTSMQLRQEECKKWQLRIDYFKDCLNPFDADNITMADVMCLTKEQKKHFDLVQTLFSIDSNSGKMIYNSSISALPLYMQKKLTTDLSGKQILDQCILTGYSSHNGCRYSVKK